MKEPATRTVSKVFMRIAKSAVLAHKLEGTNFILQIKKEKVSRHEAGYGYFTIVAILGRCTHSSTCS